MRFIIVAKGGKASSAACCEVSAMKPCELMLIGRRVVAGLGGRAAVQLGQRREALGGAPDDRERHRQPEHARPDHGLRRAADGDPDRQRVLLRPRVDAAVVDRRRGGGPTT